MSANKKYETYSASDIQKYLSGDLSAPEMHALEAAALEDPFLADALEGMERDLALRGEKAFQNDLAALRTTLDNRIVKKDRSVVLFLYRSAWRVAAAILLITGLGTISYHYLFGRRSSASPLASAENKAVRADTTAAVKAPPANAAPANAQQTDSVAMIFPAATDKDGSATTKKPSAATGQRTRQKANTLQKESLADEPAVAYHPSVHVNSKKFNMDASALPSTPALSSKSSLGYSGAAASGNSANRIHADSTNGNGKTRYLFAGKVIDGGSNNPIPLATIYFQGHHQAVRTDTNGLFRVEMLGSDPSARITINSIGYQPVSTTLNAFSNDIAISTIRLQPKYDALNAVVAEAYSSKRNDAKDKAPAPSEDRQEKDNTPSLQKAIVQQAAPVIGWTAYNNYLERNKRSAAIDSTRKGVEAVSFQVNKKGKLSSFKVEESLSPAHDSILLRLIRRGPVWKPLSGKSAGAMVTLSY